MKIELCQNEGLELAEHAAEIAEATKSDSTKKAYQADVNRFLAWAKKHRICGAPATSTTIAAYLVHLSKQGRKPTTISRALTAINQFHILNGFDKPVSPQIREINKGIRRLHGIQKQQARPITWPVLGRMLEATPDSPIGIRDRALLLLGFAGAFRRSELVAIDVSHIEFVDEGLIVSQTHSKTNQEGALRKIPIPFVDIEHRCPVRAVKDLIEFNKLDSGPIFYSLGSAGRKKDAVRLFRRLSSPWVSVVIKKYVELAGYDKKEFSGHSLRAGFATSASKAGLSSSVIMSHTGHRSHAVMMSYVRDGRQFVGHPLTSIVSSSFLKAAEKPPQE